MKNGAKIGLVAVLALCAAYVALRFWRLTDACLRFDEVFSVHAAEMSFPALFGFVARDLVHPPLFYVLLKFWIAAGGESLLWLRLFPVFFATLALVPFLYIGRELRIERTTTAAALFFAAVNGCLVNYAQEVRMYAPLLFFATLSTWLFTRFLIKGKNIWLLSAVNLLLVYTHYFGWFVVAAEVCAIVWLQRIKIRQILVMLAIALAGFAPWAAALWKADRGAGAAQNIGWIAAPDAAALFQFALDLVDPFYYPLSSAEPAARYACAVPLLILAAAALIAYFANRPAADEAETLAVRMLAAFALVPAALAFAASWVLPFAVWGTRHLIVVFVPAAYLAALAFTRARPRALAAAALALALAATGAALYAEARRGERLYVWCAWENFASTLGRARPARVYVFEDLAAYHTWFALRGAGPEVEIVKVAGVEGIAEDRAYFLPRGFDAVRVTDENGVEGARFFVAFRARAFDESVAPLRQLAARGYRFGRPEVFAAADGNAYLVEVYR